MPRTTFSRILTTETEYAEALARANALVDQNPAEGSDADHELDLLMRLLGDYEDRHVPEPAPASQQELVDFMLEQNGHPG